MLTSVGQGSSPDQDLENVGRSEERPSTEPSILYQRSTGLESATDGKQEGRTSLRADSRQAAAQTPLPSSLSSRACSSGSAHHWKATSCDPPSCPA